MKSKFTAFICARSGSKGLKNKNILNFCGKPLIAWTIQAALKSKYITDVVVSTDCNEIAQISKTYGATIPYLRPKTLAQDNSSIPDVLRDFFKKDEKNHEYIVLLQPTSPLRNHLHIDHAIEKIFLKKQSNADTLISVVRAPIKMAWLMKQNTDNKLIPCFGENTNQRQALPSLYLPNGAIYIAHIKQVLQSNNIWGNPFFFEMSAQESIDIDTKVDFDLAKKIYTESFLV